MMSFSVDYTKTVQVGQLRLVMTIHSPSIRLMEILLIFQVISRVPPAGASTIVKVGAGNKFLLVMLIWQVHLRVGWIFWKGLLL